MLISIVLALAVAGWSAWRFAFSHRMDEYDGLSLGMNMAQVEYVKDQPNYVLDPGHNEVSGVGVPADSHMTRLSTRADDLDEAAIRSHFEWEYVDSPADLPNRELDIEFDQKTGKLAKIGCSDWKFTGYCPSLGGTWVGEDESEVIRRIGEPSTRTGGPGAEEFTYHETGMWLFLLKDKLVSIGLDENVP